VPPTNDGHVFQYTIKGNTSDTDLYILFNPGVFTTDDEFCEISYYYHFDSAQNALLVATWYETDYLLPTSSSATNIVWKVTDQGNQNTELKVYSADNTYQRSGDDKIKIILKAENDMSLATAATYSVTYFLEVFPDCDQVTISPPATAIPQKTYWIYDDPLVVNFDPFKYDNAFCDSQHTFVYTMDENAMMDGGTPVESSSIITLDPATRTVQIDSDDNNFGGKTYTITVTGENEHDRTTTYSFELVIQKNC